MIDQVECAFERDVIDAIASGRWPERVDAELRAHVAGCSVCADVALVAAAIDDAHEAAWSQVRVPSAAHVWWRAQMRARREAAKRAERPITVVQGVAAASVAGLCVAASGYITSSSWWAGGMAWLDQSGGRALALPGAGSAVDWLRSALLGAGQAAAALPHVELVAAAGAVLLLMPAALYFVFTDK